MTIASNLDGANERQCGRCRQLFPADPNLYFQTDWALCPSCEEVLLPKTRRQHGAAEPGRPARGR